MESAQQQQSFAEEAPGDDESYLEENAPEVNPDDLPPHGYKAGQEPTWQAISANLRRPLKPEHVQWLPGKSWTDRSTGERKVGDAMPYVAWNTACDYLDYYAPGWSYTIVSRYDDGKLAICHVRMRVPYRGGFAERDALGEVGLTEQGYGTVGERAESKALRRAAAKFGLGRYLYSKSQRPAPPAHMQRAGYQAERTQQVQNQRTAYQGRNQQSQAQAQAQAPRQPVSRNQGWVTRGGASSTRKDEPPHAADL